MQLTTNRKCQSGFFTFLLLRSQVYANDWQSITTVTRTTPAVSGGTANADIRAAVQAIDNGALGLQIIANDLSGLVDLNLHWRNGERTGIYRVSEALNVTLAETTENPETKVNAGSFKGYVAVYALGYEGSRLSVKVGNDLVIVDPIVNNESESLFRVTDFTGTGVDIAVRIYIDRVLIDTINLTTK